MIRHVVVYRGETALVDRQTLAHLTGRSEETIRKRLTPVEYRHGKALYDALKAEEILTAIRLRGPNKPKAA